MHMHSQPRAEEEGVGTVDSTYARAAGAYWSSVFGIGFS